MPPLYARFAKSTSTSELLGDRGGPGAASGQRAIRRRRDCRSENAGVRNASAWNEFDSETSTAERELLMILGPDSCDDRVRRVYDTNVELKGC